MDVIETQFKVGDSVYVLMNNSIWNPEVVKIEIHIDTDGTSVLYWLSAGTIWHKAKYLHSSKQAVADKWLKDNNVSIGDE